jgi:uncharacterized protein
MRHPLTSCALLCALALSAPVSAQQPPTAADLLRDTVVTAGEATIKRAADQAFVTVTGESRAKAPAEAQKAVATSMSSVQKRLAALGIPADAVRTLQYDLQPEFDFNNGRQTLRGYVARNSIEVRVEPIERAGEIIDAAVQSGATSVSQLRFEVKNREAIEREALTKAVESARARAEAAAKGAARSIERIIKVEDHGVAEAPPPRPYAMAMRSVSEVAPQTPIQAGDVEIRARVTLTAQLK